MMAHVHAIKCQQLCVSSGNSVPSEELCLAAGVVGQVTQQLGGHCVPETLSWYSQQVTMKESSRTQNLAAFEKRFLPAGVSGQVAQQRGGH